MVGLSFQKFGVAGQIGSRAAEDSQRGGWVRLLIGKVLNYVAIGSPYVENVDLT